MRDIVLQVYGSLLGVFFITLFGQFFSDDKFWKLYAKILLTIIAAGLVALLLVSPFLLFGG